MVNGIKMKAELIRSENSYILKDGLNHVLGIDDKKLKDRLECPYLLSKQNCDEIFGVVDVEKLAEKEVFQEYYDWGGEVFSEDYLISKRLHFIEGFNKAMELNKDKVFTLEDMKKAYSQGELDALKTGSYSEKEKEFIQSLQQPTEIEVTFNPDEKDSEGCLILKRVV
jgi:hypothetical protein